MGLYSHCTDFIEGARCRLCLMIPLTCAFPSRTYSTLGYRNAARTVALRVTRGRHGWLFQMLVGACFCISSGHGTLKVLVIACAIDSSSHRKDAATRDRSRLWRVANARWRGRTRSEKLSRRGARSSCCRLVRGPHTRRFLERICELSAHTCGGLWVSAHLI